VEGQNHSLRCVNGPSINQASHQNLAYGETVTDACPAPGLRQFLAGLRVGHDPCKKASLTFSFRSSFFINISPMGRANIMSY
jgi:hypothetical protein